MLKFTTILVASLAMGHAAAVAAEPFQSPFVGVQAGVGRNAGGVISSPGADTRVGKSDDAVFGGIYAGWDFKLTPRVVAGGEVGFGLTTGDSLQRRLPGGSTVELDPGRTVDLTGRAGYLVDDNTLVYARGGYANVRVERVAPDQTGSLRHHRGLDGWTAGGGIERSMSERTSGRVEYRYTELDSSVAELEQHRVLFGLTYRF